jgi:hypothetical protein
MRARTGTGEKERSYMQELNITIKEAVGCTV